MVAGTRCGLYKEGFDFSADHVRRSIDESLARLGLEDRHPHEFTKLDQIVKETIPTLQKFNRIGRPGLLELPFPLSMFTYFRQIRFFPTELEWHSAPQELKVGWSASPQ